MRSAERASAAYVATLLAILVFNVHGFVRFQDSQLPVPVAEASFRPLVQRASLDLAPLAREHANPWVDMGFAAYYALQERFLGREVVARGISSATLWPWRHVALVRARDDGGPRPAGDARLTEEQATRLRARARARIRLAPLSHTVDEPSLLLILADPKGRGSEPLHLLQDRSGGQYLVTASGLPPAWRSR